MEAETDKAQKERAVWSELDIHHSDLPFLVIISKGQLNMDSDNAIIQFISVIYSDKNINYQT